MTIQKKQKRKKPFISILMPVYNVEAFIEEAIESILNQTYTNFEFIIIDDASTDNSWDIIQKYTDKRIICVSNSSNSGPFPCRNLGLRMAKGEYIAVMDGDDIALPERLEKQVDFLENHPEMLAVGSESLVIPSQTKRGTPISPSNIRLSLLENSYVLHPSLLIRYSAMMELNGYQEKYRYAGDYDLLCRLNETGDMACLPDILMHYRNHPRQITELYRSKQIFYADKIRRIYQRNFINRYRIEQQAPVEEHDLGYSLLGIVIGYYTYARHVKDSKYEKIANELLENVFTRTTEDIPLSYDQGLCGLGCGLIYLLRNGLVSGEEDMVLDEIDEKVMEAIAKPFSAKEERKSQLFYLKYRSEYHGQKRSAILEFLNKSLYEYS